MGSNSPYPKLGFLGEQSIVHKWRNHLPHWQVDKTASYFIAFRLYDSLPQSSLEKWKEQRTQSRESHPRPWSNATEAEYHRLFSTRIDKWLDAGHGECLLANPSNSGVLVEVVTARDHQDFLLHTAIIMPNHVHLLVTVGHDKPLGRVVAGWKRFSAIKIHQQTGRSGRLWQKDYFDRMIRDWAHFINVARYIRNNPTKAALSPGKFALHESEWVQRLLSD